MIQNFFKRVLLGLITLLAVITLVFFMIRLMPGSPFTKDRNIPKEVEENLKKKMHLDGTLWEQYYDYMGNVLKGDLSPSIKYRNRTVNEIIAQTLPVSFTLGSVAFVLAVGIGVSLGCLAAVKHGTWMDQSAMFLSVLGISLPSFVIGPTLILIFALKWTLFPVAGWGTLSHLVLPSLCLSLPYAAYIARLTRTSMLEVISADFIRTARAKGLSECQVIFRHALKVAILPIVSYCGPLAANILTGSLVVEEIFKIPGIASFFVNSIFSKDFTMIGGTVIVYSALLIAFNLLVDMAYSLLDSRIKLQ